MAWNVSRLLCKNRRWVGQEPKCKVRQNFDGLCAQSHCEQFCKEINGEAECFCREGFKSEGKKCKGNKYFSQISTTRCILKISYIL